MFPSSSSVSGRHLGGMNFISRSIVLCVAYLTCCVWAWPVAPSAYRRSSINDNINTNYLPYASNVAYEPDYQDTYNLYNNQNQNQWDRAREPEPSYYDVDDYLDPSTLNMNDIEAFSQLNGLYDPPVWGQIVNEKPESELEELKAEEREREAEARALEDQRKYYAYDFSGRQDKRDPGALTHQETKNVAIATATAAPISQTQSPVSSSLTTASKSKVAPSSPTASPKPARLLHQQPGMKEVPMLRPPSKAKVLGDHTSDSEPVIAVAQRSVVEKPSAYDTLRKYLSLEDALKKEADKRKGSANRIQKRAPVGKKQIISDVDSLSGQLKNLKKSAM